MPAPEIKTANVVSSEIETDSLVTYLSAAAAVLALVVAIVNYLNFTA